MGQDEILKALMEHPEGLDYTGLHKCLGIPYRSGVMTHQLRQLEKHGQIQEKIIGSRKRYFPRL